MGGGAWSYWGRLMSRTCTNVFPGATPATGVASGDIVPVRVWAVPAVVVGVGATVAPAREVWAEAEVEEDSGEGVFRTQAARGSAVATIAKSNLNFISKQG